MQKKVNKPSCNFQRTKYAFLSFLIFSSNEATLGKITVHRKSRQVDSLDHQDSKTLGYPNSQHPLHFLPNQQENENALQLTEPVTKDNAGRGHRRDI